MDLVGEVEVHGFEEAHPPILFHDLVDQRLHVLGSELAERERVHLPVQPHERRRPRGEVEIRALLLNQDLQELIDLRHSELRRRRKQRLELPLERTVRRPGDVQVPADAGLLGPLRDQVPSLASATAFFTSP